jgi:HlyD family secretion protein
MKSNTTDNSGRRGSSAPNEFAGSRPHSHSSSGEHDLDKAASHGRRGNVGDDDDDSLPPPPRERKKSGNSGGIIIFIFVLLLVGFLGAIFFVWLKSGREGNLAEKYQTVFVEEGDLHLSVVAVGNLKPVTEITVGSEISGIIQKIEVDSNDTVTKGQVLARIDTTRLDQQAAGLRAAVNLAATRVDEANATLNEAELVYNRQKDLFEKSRGRTPARVILETVTADFERAKAAVEAAKAVKDQASARLAATNTDIAKAVITSPVDGVVLTRNYEPGQTVAAGYKAPELFVIAEKLENMKVVVGVAEADITRVSVGQKATFTVDAWGKKTYPAVVTKVETGGTTTENVVTYNVELQVPNVTLSLRTGMTATATIQTAGVKRALLVPAEALSFVPPAGTAPAPASGDGSGVVWTIKNNRLVHVVVRVGLRDVHTAEISGPGVSNELTVVVGEKAKKK